MAESTREQALRHIRHCDELFDHPRHSDKEYAYNSMRLLALELVGKAEEFEFEAASPRKRAALLWKDKRVRAAAREGPLGSWNRFFRSALFPLLLIVLVVYIVSRFV